MIPVIVVLIISCQITLIGQSLNLDSLIGKYVHHFDWYVLGYLELTDSNTYEISIRQNSFGGYTYTAEGTYKVRRHKIILNVITENGLKRRFRYHLILKPRCLKVKKGKLYPKGGWYINSGRWFEKNKF